MRGRAFYAILLIIGIGCLTAGFFVRSEELRPVSGTMIGIGAGLAGLGISNLIMKQMENKRPQLKKQAQIDYFDERNTAIRNRAKAKAGDITQWLVMGIAYITILTSAPLWVTLTVVAVFLFYNFMNVYLRIKYQKEM